MFSIPGSLIFVGILLRLPTTRIHSVNSCPALSHTQASAFSGETLAVLSAGISKRWPRYRLPIDSARPRSETPFPRLWDITLDWWSRCFSGCHHYVKLQLLRWPLINFKGPRKPSVATRILNPEFWAQSEAMVGGHRLVFSETTKFDSSSSVMIFSCYFRLWNIHCVPLLFCSEHDLPLLLPKSPETPGPF